MPRIKQSRELIEQSKRLMAQSKELIRTAEQIWDDWQKKHARYPKSPVGLLLYRIKPCRANLESGA